MKIHTFDVGPGNPCFIVAEGGSNHGGSLDAALALTDAAAEAGANAMKWQLWLHPDEMYDRDQFPYEWEAADNYQLDKEWLPALRDRAHENGMAFGLSSFGFASLDEADKWVDFHKVASIESTWFEFAFSVLKKEKPTLISLGLNSGVGDWWYSEWEFRTVNLQCVVDYPSAIEDTHLHSHPPVTNWGLSDHTLHPTIAPCAAVALGACVIEKHITEPTMHSNPNFISPDYRHSIWPDQFKEMVSAIRMTEQALGSSEKRIRPSEEPYLRFRRGPKGLRGS